MTNTLTWIDWSIVAFYAMSTILLGWYFGRKQKSTDEYFVASGHMNPILIGVSLFASLLSTISYLAIPGEIIGKGPVYLVRMFALPFVFGVVGFYIIPLYMKQRVTSAYELLEDRLGVSVRLLGVAMFLALRLVWMTILTYKVAEAMTVMLGIPEFILGPDQLEMIKNPAKPEWILGIVMITGLVSVIYTSLGGLKAVVITDLIQTVLLFGGALLVVVLITIHFGGFSWFPTKWHANWDRQPFAPSSLTTRVTVIGTFSSVLIWLICTAGGDQVSVQRFMATSDAKAARRAYATQLMMTCLVTLLLSCVGFALLSYFESEADQLAKSGFLLKENADKFFPYFIANHLPIGISGLVIAAMFAAAMSSIDSGVNSISAVVMTDLLDRFGLKPKTEKGHIRIARFLAFGIGLVVVLGSSFVGLIPGNITGVTEKTVNLLVTPIFSLFIFALFFPAMRAWGSPFNKFIPTIQPLGVWIGWFFGVTIAVLIAFSGPIFVPGYNPKATHPMDPVSFQWIGIYALAFNIGTTWIASLFINNRNSKKQGS